MMLVDLDSPGIEHRPIALAGGREEIAEICFTNVAVDRDRVIGEVDGGWAVAMDLLQYERGNYARMRMAAATSHLQELLHSTDAGTVDDPLAAVAVGRAYLNLAALRAGTSSTRRRLFDDDVVGSQTSVDKLLLSAAEQDVLDAALAVLDTDILIGDKPHDARWCDEWWYSRAAFAANGDRLPSAVGQFLVVHPFGSLASTGDSGRLQVDGVALAKPSAAGCYVIAGDNCPTAYAVATTKVAPPTPVGGFDPSSALGRVRFDIAIDDTREHERGWELATAAARRALACELIGNGHAMLDIAVDHVAQRHQLGRPIGVNQTPRHRLADAYVQLSAAHELVRIAYVSERPWDATVAMTYAGYAVETTSSACLQVCGAMGLTAEHPLGGYVKRFRTLDALYGRWRQTMRTLGERLVQTRVIPRGVGV